MKQTEIESQAWIKGFLHFHPNEGTPFKKTRKVNTWRIIEETDYILRMLVKTGGNLHTN